MSIESLAQVASLKRTVYDKHAVLRHVGDHR